MSKKPVIQIPRWTLVSDGHWLLTTEDIFLAAVVRKPTGSYLASTNDGRGRLAANLDDALAAADELMRVDREIP